MEPLCTKLYLLNLLNLPGVLNTVQLTFISVNNHMVTNGQIRKLNENNLKGIVIHIYYLLVGYKLLAIDSAPFAEHVTFIDV